MGGTAFNHAACNLGGQLTEGVHSIGIARRIDEAGHTPNDGGGFILDDDFSARVADVLSAIDSVGAHAGHHDRQYICAVGSGN